MKPGEPKKALPKPKPNDRNMGNAGTADESNPVTAYEIFNKNIYAIG